MPALWPSVASLNPAQRRFLWVIRLSIVWKAAAVLALVAWLLAGGIR